MLRGQIQKFSEKFNKTLDKVNSTCYNKDNEDTPFLEFIIKLLSSPKKPVGNSLRVLFYVRTFITADLAVISQKRTTPL